MLINFTHYSLQIGLSKPKQLVEKCLKAGYDSCAITDLNTISGCVEFYIECKNNNIKPILGMSLESDTQLFAKNIKGWKKLIKIVSGELETDLDGDLICLSNNEKFKEKFKDFRKNDGSIRPSYYCDEEDADIHKILVCGGLKIKINEIPNEKRYLFIDSCFSTDGIPQLAECIIESCEEYNILSNPILPVFPTNGETEEEFLKEICRQGWRNKIAPILKTDKDKQIYLDRFTHEFSIIKAANLFGYFLIVHDIVSHANMQGFITGVGRGSACGCLISYLMGITQLDPIKYNLLFERFYNTSRNTDGNISLPDIDLDVPSSKRDNIIKYVINKYGKDNVAQICTYSRLQGRSVLKEILRITTDCSNSEMNAITKHIPDEAAISDELEKMDKEDKSIIKWSLIHKKKELEPFCQIDENGDLHGEYADVFQKGIRLEGTFKNVGTHAAGIIISKIPIKEICPVIDNVIQMEMEYIEALGLAKFDILGVAVLSKLMRIRELAND
jgi:DNA polymerase-3 subunit alpha